MNPIDEIELKHGFQGLGSMGLDVYKGAIEDGATILDAFYVTAAFFKAILTLDPKDEEEKDELSN